MNRLIKMTCILSAGLILIGCGSTDTKQEEPAVTPSEEKQEPVLETGCWYDENGSFYIDIYEIGGFMMEDENGRFYGYAEYTEEDDSDSLSEHGPRWQLFTEDNKRVYNDACLSYDESHPGQLTLTYGGGAFLLTKDTEDVIDEVVVQAEWADDVPDVIFSKELDFSTEENSADVVFTAKYVAREFQILKLTVQDVDQEGNVNYEIESLYRGFLVPNRPIKAKLSFIGDIPNYGISYIDEGGETVIYTLSESGMDGSLILSEY